MLKIKNFILIICCGVLLTSCSSSQRTVGHSNNSPIIASTTPSPSSLKSVNDTTPMNVEVTARQTSDLIEDQLIALIQNLLQTPEALTGGDLLVDNIKSKSADDIHLPQQFDSNLLNLLSINSHFNIVSNTKIQQAAQVLGLDSDIVNNNSMKAIALARYLQTQYVLYTNITESNKQLILTMQLLMVKSGEIIWQDSSTLPLTQLAESN